jgi:uncharacterized protein (TIGR03790 family)
MKITELILILILMNVYTFGQYQDVGVIINTNSPTSIEIGNYFRVSRSIPSSNMIFISVSTSEEIDSTEFENVRTQIENRILNGNLENRLNYLVTTKGVPLKVNRGNTFSTSSPSASVESELTLLLGLYAGNIGKNGRQYSPYYAKNETFSRAKYGIYLVTRLDGYTIDGIKSMIDRSGPETTVNDSVQFVFDQDPLWNSSAQYLNTNMEIAAPILISRLWTVELNTDTGFIKKRVNVLGYVSWGSNDHNFEPIYFMWSPGSLAETYVSTSGRSFELPSIYGQSLIADLLSDGLTGAKGYVYESYSSSMADVSVLFGRYTSGSNLAESFYMASRYLSWMDVIIGDPKTTIIQKEELKHTKGWNLASIPRVCKDSSISTLFPDATGAFMYDNLQYVPVTHMTPGYGYWLNFPSSGTDTIHGLNIKREVVLHDRWNIVGPMDSISNGEVFWGYNRGYFIVTKFERGKGYWKYLGSERTILSIPSVPFVSEVADAHIVTTAGVTSYPNPFNSTTIISFRLETTSEVRLVIYDILGREVRTLVDKSMPAGQHIVSFNGKGLASGTYICNLRINKEAFTTLRLRLIN